MYRALNIAQLSSTGLSDLNSPVLLPPVLSEDGHQSATPVYIIQYVRVRSDLDDRYSKGRSLWSKSLYKYWITHLPLVRVALDMSVVFQISSVLRRYSMLDLYISSGDQGLPDGHACTGTDADLLDAD